LSLRFQRLLATCGTGGFRHSATPGPAGSRYSSRKLFLPLGGIRGMSGRIRRGSVRTALSGRNICISFRPSRSAWGRLW
jgi:hypothetical protein